MTVTRDAVCSYHAFSPLPCGGLFSVPLSVILRYPAVNWHFALCSPDFPPRVATRRLSDLAMEMLFYHVSIWVKITR